jgi:putative membrane protein
MATEIPLDTGTKLAGKRTDWAALRTRFGSERTLMAAIRTSLSLIGFGFTIYTFFESLRKAMGEEGPVRVYSPRRLGLTLVSLGVFVMFALLYSTGCSLRNCRRNRINTSPGPYR